MTQQRNVIWRAASYLWNYRWQAALPYIFLLVATLSQLAVPRLIRSRSDRGVLVLLDNRISKQRYGQVFFDSLPDYGFTTRLEDVEKFFDV